MEYHQMHCTSAEICANRNSCALLRKIANDSKHLPVIEVLQRCHAESDAQFAMVIAELNSCGSNAFAIGSLKNEIYLYREEQYQQDVAKHIREEGYESEELTYALTLSIWLELYQIWCRGIT
ncbi:hypothetical protein A3C37_04850 [Candidatus Peribacteria bacterium RIFCSPHIGHO2_02_FULL_53_20]|nr:MAG: hypothetical protein A3C37_04850 [Candidatus Peribacteria bacterium RIFCSPHIGHO2_02_FULL_53_20]OGJ68258.1 MAG: hypothetical protein A3B61_03815 [Candidatus Peribacteria bacterium RIFCSPLOWO2_01_FULL_53_10]OGJ73223.1 MAG: hypothetical protein A3G69_05055 [Candidatus Peribacteria bacterium RIFCSPLOWO2_12_FULL_53_10]